MSQMYVVRHSATPGRYSLDGIELTSGSLIAFIHANTSLAGRVEHDGVRYVVHTQDGRRVPLEQVFFARHVGSGRL